MTRTQMAIVALLLAAVAAGSASDGDQRDPPLTIDGSRVLAADFHVHPSVFSAGALAPWDLVLEARRRRLDVIAITPHNQVFTAKLGRWFAARAGGPTVVAGEEIRNATFHIIALGIVRGVSWDQAAASAVDAVHAQGGVAIAAHPTAAYWPGLGGRATLELDGSEVMHPAAFLRPQARADMRQFYERRRMTAIGSSDYHGLGAMGLCRTYVFARDDSEAAVIEALKAGRTIVYDRDGTAYGDPHLLATAARSLALRERERAWESSLTAPAGGSLAALSRLAGVIALLFATLFNRPATVAATATASRARRPGR